MSNLIILEWVNGVWFILSLAVTAMFVHVVVNEMRFDGWYYRDRARAAIALATYFCGETLMRGWVWMLIKIRNSGGDARGIQEQYQIAFLAAALAVVGALCCIRVFSPPAWGHWPWLVVAGFAAAFFGMTVTL